MQTFVPWTLGHILLGCDAYVLHPLMTSLLTVLDALHPNSSFKTLSPDSWGTSPWFPLLVLGALEEAAYPIVKGRKGILKGLKKSRQQREWIIGNYYWALWKWRMKEIHDADFKFVPANCMTSLLATLSTPVPAHLLKRAAADEDSKGSPDKGPGPASAPLVGDLQLLPPPVSHLGRGDKIQLSERGKSILCAIRAPVVSRRSHCLPRREAILRALTDNAYT